MTNEVKCINHFFAKCPAIWRPGDEESSIIHSEICYQLTNHVYINTGCLLNLFDLPIQSKNEMSDFPNSCSTISPVKSSLNSLQEMISEIPDTPKETKKVISKNIDETGNEDTTTDGKMQEMKGK